MDEGTMELRVSSSTQVKQLATSILRNLDEGRALVIACIGMHPLNTAMKAVSVANGEAAQNGFLLSLVPSFKEREFPDRHTSEMIVQTALRFFVVRLSLFVQPPGTRA